MDDLDGFLRHVSTLEIHICIFHKCPLIGPIVKADTAKGKIQHTIRAVGT
jgi:hypothetical protein